MSGCHGEPDNPVVRREEMQLERSEFAGAGGCGGDAISRTLRRWQMWVCPMCGGGGGPQNHVCRESNPVPVDFSAELVAMKSIGDALAPLDANARERVVRWAMQYFGLGRNY